MEHFLQQGLELRARNLLAALPAHRCAFGSQIEEVRIQRRVVLQVDLLLALRDAVERRLRDVQMVLAGALLRLPRHHIVHLSVEEREQQRADVAAVNVGVRHQDDLVVAQLLDVELVVDASADRRDHGGDLLRREHLVEARFLDVEDLAAQGKDRLRPPIAALLRRPACGVSLDDVELALLGVALLAVSQLARQRRRVERTLAADRLARLSRRNARARRIGHLRHHPLRDPGIALPILGQLAPDEVLDDALRLGVDQLALEIAFELRAGDLHRDDGGKAFADVLARGRLLDLLPGAVLLAVLHHRAGERALEADQVRAAVDGVDVVGEREHLLVEAVVPLQRHVHLGAVDVPAHRDGRVEQHRLVLVQELHVGDDSAVVLEVVALVRPLVAHQDAQARVEERELAHPVREHVEVEVGGLEHGGVGLEGDPGPAKRGAADRLHLPGGNARLVPLLEDLAFPIDLDLQPLAERVDAGDADAVEATGDLVRIAVELAAGVELGHHDVERVHRLRRVRPHGNSAAVVLDRERAIGVDGQLDSLRVTAERFVDGVVHDLVHVVVQALRADATDVHVRALADGFEPLEDLDAVSRVFTCGGHRRGCPLLVRSLQNLTSGKCPELSPETRRKQGEKALRSL